jgi:hypothetical protein
VLSTTLQVQSGNDGVLGNGLDAGRLAPLGWRGGKTKTDLLVVDEGGIARQCGQNLDRRSGFLVTQSSLASGLTQHGFPER